MDFRSAGSARRVEKVPDNTASVKAATLSHAESADQRFVVVHLLHDSRGEHRVGSRVSRGRTCISSTTSRLFHQ